MNTVKECNKIALERINFTLSGFHRYTMHAVNMVANFKGDIPEDSIKKEEAYINEHGDLVIEVKSTDGDLLSSFKFEKNEYKLEDLN